MQPHTVCLYSKLLSLLLTALQGSAGIGERSDPTSEFLKVLGEQDGIGKALLQQEQQVSTPNDVDAKIQKKTTDLQKNGKLLMAYVNPCVVEGASQLMHERKDLVQKLCDAASKLPTPPPPTPLPHQLVGQLQQQQTQLEQLFPLMMQPTNADSARAVANPATPLQQQQQQQQHESAASMPWVSAH